MGLNWEVTGAMPLHGAGSRVGTRRLWVMSGVRRECHEKGRMGTFTGGGGQRTTEHQDESTPLGSPRPWACGLCSPQSLSAEDTNPPWWVAASCKSQAELGQQAGCVLGSLGPHTGMAGARQEVACLAYSRLAGQVWLCCPRPPMCGEHSWPDRNRPAQSASFSLHSCCPQGWQGQPRSWQLTAPTSLALFTLLPSLQT